MAKPQKANNTEPASTALTTIETPGAIQVYDYSQYANAGFEGATDDDFAPPLLILAQGLTPEVKNGLARCGDFISRVTGQVWQPPVQIIPVFPTCRYVEWRPRKAGGGFVASHLPDSEVALKAREEQPMGKRQVERMIDGNRVVHDLVQTHYVYCLLFDYKEEQWIPMIVPFTGTKITPYRRFMSRSRNILGTRKDGSSFTFPMFAHKWILGSEEKSNAQGDFHNFYLELAAERAQDCRLSPDSELFQRALAYYERSKAGKVRIDDAQMVDDEGAPHDSSDTPF